VGRIELGEKKGGRIREDENKERREAGKIKEEERRGE
jgi:hypothetical protein